MLWCCRWSEERRQHRHTQHLTASNKKNQNGRQAKAAKTLTPRQIDGVCAALFDAFAPQKAMVVVVVTLLLLCIVVKQIDLVGQIKSIYERLLPQKIERLPKVCVLMVSSPCH